MSITEKPSKASNFVFVVVFVFFKKSRFVKLSQEVVAAVFGVKLLTIGRAGLLIGRGRKSQISRDFWRQIRGKIGRFRGSFRSKSHQKAIGKKGPILWLFSWQILLEIDQFCADQASIFNVFLTEVIICSFKDSIRCKEEP